MRKFNLLLISIFLLAFGLRFWMLDLVPTGFSSDSIDIAYIGKYLILNGRDPSGNILPLYFNKFGDFRPTGLFYLSGLAQLFLGSSVIVVRLIPAFFGAISVFILYLFTFELFKKKEIAYFSSLFLALLPWDIVLSRDIHEAIVGYFFTIAGFYFILRFVRDNKARKYLIFGTCLLLFSYLFYHGIRTLTPLLLLVFWLFYRGRDLAWAVVIFFVFTLIIMVSPYGGGRLGQVVFYKNPAITQKLNELPYADGNLAFARIFHNKAVVYSRSILSTWFEHFSPDFLFLKGGYPERYMVPETGLIYVSIGLVFIFGIINIFRKPREVGLLIAWLLVSPIQAALTYEDVPSVTRASFMIFPIVILGGAGAWWAYFLLKNNYWRRILSLLFFIVMFIELLYFMHHYLVHQKGNKGILRGDGNIEMNNYIISQKNNYDLILVPYLDNLPFYLLFLENNFDRDIKVDITDSSSGFQYQNVQYVMNGCPSHITDQYAGRKVLYVDEPWCEVKPDVQDVYNITRADLTTAWIVRVAK